MVKILSAKFGDEFGSTDVLTSLSNRVKDDGIDVYVDSSLIPMMDKATGANSTELSSDDKQDIRDTVAQMCGPSDQACIAIKTEELAQSKLKQKEATKTTSTAQVIKGRRLTVEYQDATGTRRTAVVPEGQQFQVDKLGKPPENNAPIETETPAYVKVFQSWWGILGTAVAMFLWVSSIIITWMTYDRYGSKITAGIMTAVAVFIPYSGFGLSFFGPFLAEYFRVDKLARLKAVVPEEMATANPAFLPKVGPGIIPAVPPVLEDPTPLAASMKGGLRRILSQRK